MKGCKSVVESKVWAVYVASHCLSLSTGIISHLIQALQETKILLAFPKIRNYNLGLLGATSTNLLLAILI